MCFKRKGEMDTVNDFEEIVMRIRNSYGNCTEYFDLGIATSEFNTAHRSQLLELVFTTSFFRGSSIAMTFHRRNPKYHRHTRTCTIAARLVDRDSEYWWGKYPNISPVPSLHSLLAGSTGTSLGLSLLIVPLLIPDAYQYGTLHKFAAPHISEVNVEGVDYICLSCDRSCERSGDVETSHQRVALHSSTTLWIDKKSYMIKKSADRIVAGDHVIEEKANINVCYRGN